MTPIEFLLARIADDKRMAEGWRGENAAVEFHDHGDVYVMDPQPWVRVLAECDAKRLLIERVGNPDWAGFRILALPYADHPDFDEAWR